MTSKEELYKYLAAEQIDGVALAIQNIEKGYGVIIGDQTGIGKGRQAAAIVRYGILNGYNTIFVTEKSTLFTDLYRDLKDINSEDFVPYIFNNDKAANIRNENGQLYAEVKNNQKYRVKLTNVVETDLQAALTKNGGKELPSGYDFAMLTYTQIQGDKKAAENRKDAVGGKVKAKTGKQGKSEFIRAYAENAVFILDESHNAGGTNSIMGFYFREVLAKAKGCCFLSATFAKRPDNMPLYGVKTSLLDAELTDTQLIKVFEVGGLALQEVTASELVAAGQMIRRQRTFDGIEFNWNFLTDLSTQQWDMVDKVTEIMRDIVAFQNEHIKPFVEEINDNMFGETKAEERKGVKNFGADNVDFFSKAHNVIFQLMFSLKAEAVASRAIELLGQDKKIVIAFSSTMGSFLNGLGLVDGDEVERMDFAEILKKGLDGVFGYSVNDGGEYRKEEIELSDLGAAGQDLYKYILGKIKSVTTGLSLSPIDVLINTIESTKRPKNIGGTPAKYYRVRECTGRNVQIRYEDGVPIYRRFKADKELFFRQFNHGDADVLLINQTAATGVSAHSSKKFADQRQRGMLLHQPELNISVEVQKLGRINRTGQVNLPFFEYISSTVPSEKRQFMILKSKLKSLDANTTGNQQNSKNQLDMVDFMNKYGGHIIFEYLRNSPKMNALLGDPCYRESVDRDGFSFSEKIPNEDIPRRVTNRVQLLPVKQQEIFYDTVVEKYLAYVEELKETGEYDLEVEYLNFQAEIQKRYLYVQGSGKDSPFGQNSVLDLNLCKVLKKPYNRKRIEEAIKEKLRGKTADEHIKVITNKFEQDYPKLIAERLRSRKTKAAELVEKIATAKVKLGNRKQIGKNDGETEKLKNQYEKAANRLESLKNKLSDYQGETSKKESDFLADQINLANYFKILTIGNVVQIPMMEQGAEFTLNGVVLDLKINWKEENPFTPSNIQAKIAVNSTHIIIIRTLSDKRSYQMLNKSINLTPDFKKFVFDKWDDSISNHKQDAVFISTGNVFKALDKAKTDLHVPRLFKYSVKDGSFKNGIVMGYADTPSERGINKWMREHQSFFSARIGLSGIYKQISTMTNGDKLEIIPEKIVIYKRAGTSYYLVIAPKGNKPILVDTDILKLAELTAVERANKAKFGNFRTYSASLQYAEFKGEIIIDVLKILQAKHGITMSQDKPIEIPIIDEAKAAEKVIDIASMLKMLSIEIGNSTIKKDNQIMYAVASIQPSKYPNIAKFPIQKQGNIKAKFGEELQITRAIDLVREASENFKKEHPKAIQLDGMIYQFLTKNGFEFEDSAKAKKLKLAEAKIKIQAQRIRVLKLKAA